MKICGTDIKIRGQLIRTASPELEKYELLHDPEAVIDGLQKSGIRVDLFTFMQLMPETSPRYGYPMEWDNLAVLSVSTFDHWWNHQIRSEARNRARQAEKRGVTIREAAFDEALVQGIWEVYNESPVRQGKPNVHYGKDLEAVYREAATFLDRSIFIGAFLDQKLIGFVKLVTDESCTYANMMNIVAMIKYRDKAPSNGLIMRSVRSCAERGIRYLAYQSYAYGKREDSLTNFKDINGFRRVDLPRYYVPLSPLGWAALRFGLHHRLVDRLPESVAYKLRELRSAWHNRKLRPVTGAS
ncbi:MAG: hypothetical protein DMG85_08620 [Acidobacteria bacterium]|nr:MAG: hypothetical protein DMG85_08620 [Acidobacteriota bacterium]